MQNGFLEFSHLDFSHIDAQIAELIYAICIEYSIIDCTLNINMDNMYNNNTTTSMVSSSMNLILDTRFLI